MISGRTRICGIIGCPVGHSFSPAMHNSAFKHLEMDWVYVPYQVEPADLPAAVAAVKALNMAGVNVTVPHKQAAACLVDELSPDARLSGAINTIVNSENKLIGHNTDGEGFIKSLEESTGILPKHCAALVLGSGGAARAVSVALALNKSPEIFISNRSLTKAAALADLINNNTGCRASVLPWPKDYPAGFEDKDKWLEVLKKVFLVVQTTPLGMHPREKESIPFPYELLTPEHTVVDLVYNPSYTRFMEQCSMYGARVFNGIGMLLHQGAIAFKLWTGIEPPIEVMRKALEAEIAKQFCVGSP